MAKAAHSLTPNCRAFASMARDPDKHRGEYLAIKALMALDIEDFLHDLHAAHPTDPYPAQRLDPDMRAGRRSDSCGAREPAVRPVRDSQSNRDFALYSDPGQCGPPHPPEYCTPF